jgi:uncharacterized membrane protein YbhN (UPF0104 family)
MPRTGQVTLMSGSLPAGPALGTACTYRQLRRRQIDEAVTTWMLTFAGVASAAGLLGLTAIGLLVGCLDTVEARLLLGALVAAAAAMVTLLAAESWRAQTITVVAMAIGRIETVALRVAGEPRDRTVDYSRPDLAACVR